MENRGRCKPPTAALYRSPGTLPRRQLLLLFKQGGIHQQVIVTLKPGMAHWTNVRENTPFTWAGQSADDPFSQQWASHNGPSAQPTGPADLLSTDTPRNLESLIKDFNDELQNNFQPGSASGQPSSCRSVDGAGTDQTDLPFDLVIDNDIDLDAAKPTSSELARTSSQASSSGVDEEESVSFSHAGDFNGVGFDDSFGHGFFSGINSPSTTFSDAILSTNPSLENSPPIITRCPYLIMQADNHVSGASSATAANTPQSSIIGIDDAISDIGFATADTPRSVPGPHVSALSTGLANQSPFSATLSPPSPYFDRFDSDMGEDRVADLDSLMWDTPSSSGGFIPYSESQLGPSLVVVPPDMSDVHMSDFGECTSPDAPSSSQTHPIDYYLTEIYTPPLLTQPRSVPNTAVPPNPATAAAGQLLVPDRRRRRRSDPVRIDAAIRGQAPRLQPTIHGASSVLPRRSPVQRATAQFLSVSGGTHFQRLRPSEPPRRPGVTEPMPIMVHLRRLSNSSSSISSDTQNLVGRPGRSGPARGRRHGPMDPVSRGQAKETRNKKMVCIRCKQSKQKCKRSDDSSDGSCIGCDRHGGSQRWPGPCVRAHFEDLIQAGTCNYISQHAIYHPTLNGKTRIRRELPKHIQIDNLIHRLDCVRNQFNIRVHQKGRSIYVLDLDSCHEYLLGLRQQMDGSECSFQGFIDREILRVDPKTDDWERCMTQVTTSRDDLLALLCLVNNMPSRASFSYVVKQQFTSLGTPVEGPMNVENPQETDNLILAAQLSKIICRKLEVKAYGQLQRLLHESGTMDDDKVLPFLQRLGRILLTLRWRLSWWAVVPGDATAAAVFDQTDNARKQAVYARVQSLCRILYFYYCSVRRRLPVWTNIEALSGIRSKYPDTEAEVWDDFPGNECIEGFEAWMEQGKRLIDQAGVLNRLRSMGLTA
ncbi:hypothetical protein CORC01_01283 [Colletotrichum orchidophilum]|uniref:Uncharacterized protein n=1 Tax=Colletotrichum orchidophilum TaxID=1209926 RepID=A0A1G4BQ57_9PEZI|nr:uncharacterized protein CORC01_01283 [Colletotrichum orchidophilum]OHF03564.1 hypothetical protein CORC01_01283 [Colletotrichum orchidophilum]